ncbi:MAG: hydroxyacid dehydrogenase [Tissierellia bacterium]|jgi:D-3-phosphoglycerate dehydrogenase|nr:hydroxyacid dehydrogenase [Tissierellia bacterium]
MKVLVTEKIHNTGLEELKKYHDVEYYQGIDREKFLEIIGDFDALVVRADTPVDEEVIEKGVNLKCIAMAGIGLNHIDVEYAKSKEIEIYNVADGSIQSVAELALGLMLMTLRDLNRCAVDVKNGKWDKPGYPGNTINGKTVGILALGKIGFRVAELCQAFGAKVVAYDPYLPQEIADKIGVQLLDLDEVMKQSDIISIHSPLTDETYHMINDEKLKMMKPGSYIFNLGRGGIVDEEALYENLMSGQIKRAAFDVLEHEPPRPEDKKLLELDKFILTCHIGAGAEEAQEYISERVAAQVNERLES